MCLTQRTFSPQSYTQNTAEGSEQKLNCFPLSSHRLIAQMMGKKPAVVFRYSWHSRKDLTSNILSNILLTCFVVSQEYALVLCSFYCVLMVYSSRMDSE